MLSGIYASQMMSGSVVIEPITLPASAFVRGVDVAMASGVAAEYGTDALMNAPPYINRPNAAEWDFNVFSAGNYEVFGTYASESSRPVSVLFNGVLSFSDALSAATGGFYPANRQTFSLGTVTLPAGANVMRVFSSMHFPHIAGFELVKL